MCRFIETVRVEGDVPVALAYHQARVDETLRVARGIEDGSEIGGSENSENRGVGFDPVRLDLRDIVYQMISENKESLVSGTIYKARVIYNSHGKVLEYSLLPYTVRKIRGLRLVECDMIDYSLKYADRSGLEALKARVQESKGMACVTGTTGTTEVTEPVEADEIIIVRHGLLTDTSYSNIALYDGEKWVTPRTPLLKGTMRQRLLDEGQLIEADITPEALKDYQQICLINAMMPLGCCCIDTSHISY